MSKVRYVLFHPRYGWLMKPRAQCFLHVQHMGNIQPATFTQEEALSEEAYWEMYDFILKVVPLTEFGRQYELTSAAMAA